MIDAGLAARFGEMFSLQERAARSWSREEAEQRSREFDTARNDLAKLPPSFEKGAAALAGAALRLTPDWDPMVGSAILWCLEHDFPADPSPTLDIWREAIVPASPLGDPYPFYDGHPPNALDHFACSSDGFELLIRVEAHDLVKTALPAFQRTLTEHTYAAVDWGDAFALWTTVRSRGLSTLVPAQLAGLGESTDLAARESLLPRSWQGVELIDAGSMRALGLRHLGMATDLYRPFVERLDSEEVSRGVWPNATGGHGDVLATIAAADFLARSRSADLAPTIEWLLSQQGEDGLWWYHGHAGTWLTRQVLGLIELSRRPPADRFLWPSLSPATRDAKVGIGNIAHFDLSIRTLIALDSGSWVGIAFLDLVDFGSFNNRMGQASGDDCLRTFAATIASLEGVEVARDGGDEFLVWTAPDAPSVLNGLGEKLSSRWRTRFAATFPSGSPEPRARGVWTVVMVDEVSAARRRLGAAIGELKSRQKGQGVVNDADLIVRV